MSYAGLSDPFQDSEKAKSFCENFIKAYTTPAFGAISKTEIDNVVFGLMVESGSIDPKSQIYEIARDLHITPTKARNLLFQWQLRDSDGPESLKDDVAEVLKTARFGKDGNLLVFGIESPILREELRSLLKKQRIFADASFSSEIVRLKVDHFVEFLEIFLEESTMNKMRETLVKDGQVKDKSFRAIVTGIVGHLAKRAAGPDAGEFLVDFIQQLLQGNPNALADGCARWNPVEQ